MGVRMVKKVLLIFIVLLYSCKDKEPLLKGTYDHYIGYLNPEKTNSEKKFEVCGDGQIRATHHGLTKRAYKPNKGVFDEGVFKAYQNENYNESGYVFFRFIVNCRGETGRFDIVQTDLNMEKKSFSNQAMVQKLFDLTKDKKNWNGFVLGKEKKEFNYYMYVSYKILNGEIAEILP